MIFLQRVGTSANVPFTGDRARVLDQNGAVVVDWTTGGTIPNVPQGDGYTLQVQTGSTTTSDKLAIGAVVFTIGQSNIERWFNTAVFSQPAPFTFGNAPRWVGDVRSDHNNNMDMAIMKNYRVREKANVQFRGEFFNAFNRNRFGSPITGLGSKDFGTVTGSMSSPRRIQLALRVTF